MTDKIMTDLEKEFKSLVDSYGAEINGLLNRAAGLVEEAVELSKAHGIPFRSSVEFRYADFIPGSFKAKFGALMPDEEDEEFEANKVYLSKFTLESFDEWINSSSRC